MLKTLGSNKQNEYLGNVNQKRGKDILTNIPM